MADIEGLDNEHVGGERVSTVTVLDDETSRLRSASARLLRAGCTLVGDGSITCTCHDDDFFFLDYRAPAIRRADQRSQVRQFIRNFDGPEMPVSSAN